MVTDMPPSPSESLKQSLGELLGLARGLMADEKLTNSEIHFLHNWLEERYSMTSSFPGNVIHERIKDVLEDGVITEEERSHLVDTLNMLIEDRLEDLAGPLLWCRRQPKNRPSNPTDNMWCRVRPASKR